MANRELLSTLNHLMLAEVNARSIESVISQHGTDADRRVYASLMTALEAALRDVTGLCEREGGE